MASSKSSAVRRRSASVPAAYLIDGPAAMPMHARIADKDGGYTDYTANLQVANVAPVVSNLTTNAASYIENDTVTLSGTVTDAGKLDSHSVLITWADGSTSTIVLPAGVMTFSAAHQYLNDPSGPDDHYHIVVTATDKDGVAGTATKDVLVSNAAPVATARAIDGTAPTLIALTSSGTDVGTLDVLTYHWTATQVFANGTSQVVATGSTRDFQIARQNGATYLITLTVSDPDGGVGTDTSLVVSGTAAAEHDQPRPRINFRQGSGDRRRLIAR